MARFSTFFRSLQYKNQIRRATFRRYKWELIQYKNQVLTFSPYSTSFYYSIFYSQVGYSPRVYHAESVGTACLYWPMLHCVLQRPVQSVSGAHIDRKPMLWYIQKSTDSITRHNTHRIPSPAEVPKRIEISYRTGTQGDNCVCTMYKTRALAGCE